MYKILHVCVNPHLQKIVTLRQLGSMLVDGLLSKFRKLHYFTLKKKAVNNLDSAHLLIHNQNELLLQKICTQSCNFQSIGNQTSEEIGLMWTKMWSQRSKLHVFHMTSMYAN